MCNPQDQSQMHREMSWGPTDDLTEEERSQMAEDLGWLVQECNVPIPKEPLGKAMVEQGFASDKAA
eukprot:8182619-Karenia_brevis.AAC.1